MNSFKMSDNVSKWIEVLAARYIVQFGNCEAFTCKWKNTENEEILVQINKRTPTENEVEKIITVTIYLTTNLITIRGNFYQQWCNEEFESLKKVVNHVQFHADEDSGDCDSDTDTELKFVTPSKANTETEQRFVTPNKTTTDTEQNSETPNRTIIQNKNTPNQIKKKFSDSNNEFSGGAELKLISNTLQKLESQYCQQFKIMEDIKEMGQQTQIEFDHKLDQYQNKIESKLSQQSKTIEYMKQNVNKCQTTSEKQTQIEFEKKLDQY